MAGHKNALVRPKQTVQNPLRIAAGSPLAIQGVFLEILRERFQVNANIGLVWREDITTSDIIIETGFNEETESRNKIPALYVNRLQMIPSKIVLGDRAGVRLPNQLDAQGALNTVAISIECVANDEGQSAVLGDLVQFTLLASQDIIQKEFGFNDMAHPSLSQTVPYDRDQTKWSTSVDFQVQFWIRWAHVPIAPLLQQIALRIKNKGDADSYFVEIAKTSLMRGGAMIDGMTYPPSNEAKPNDEP